MRRLELRLLAVSGEPEAGSGKQGAGSKEREAGSRQLGDHDGGLDLGASGRLASPHPPGPARVPAGTRVIT